MGCWGASIVVAATAMSLSTEAVGRRVDRPVDDDGGGIVKGASLLLDSFPLVLAGEAGFRLPEGTAPGGLATGFGPPWTSLDTPGWGQHRRWDRRRQLSCRFRLPLEHMTSSSSSFWHHKLM